MCIFLLQRVLVRLDSTELETHKRHCFVLLPRWDTNGEIIAVLNELIKSLYIFLVEALVFIPGGKHLLGGYEYEGFLEEEEWEQSVGIRFEG